jgi:hypothetical protein
LDEVLVVVQMLVMHGLTYSCSVYFQMYVPPQTVDGIEGGTEVYEVPDVEAGPAVERRLPPRIPAPR